MRGILKGDRGGRYIVNEFGDTAIPPPGATDAYMAPYHVTRSCLFVKERFATEHAIDAGVLIHNIEMTRFQYRPTPFYQRVGDYAGLVRAADLIGQMADPQYLQKLSRLYTEFNETGEAERLGYTNAGELRAEYPSFFFERVRPYISEGLRYLRKTQEGQLWIANLFSHVYAEQHCEPSYGPERRLHPDERTTTSAARPTWRLPRSLFHAADRLTACFRRAIQACPQSVESAVRRLTCQTEVAAGPAFSWSAPPSASDPLR